MRKDASIPEIMGNKMNLQLAMCHRLKNAIDSKHEWWITLFFHFSIPPLSKFSFWENEVPFYYA